MKKFFYHINLNERGSFRADVRDENEKTILEILGGDEIPHDSTSIFDDGWMRDYHDMRGLKEYLVHLDLIAPDDSLVFVG